MSRLPNISYWGWCPTLDTWIESDHDPPLCEHGNEISTHRQNLTGRATSLAARRGWGVVVVGQTSLLRFDAAHSRGATEEILVVRCPQPVTNERVPHTPAIPELLRVDAQHTVVFGVAQQNPPDNRDDVFQV